MPKPPEMLAHFEMSNTQRRKQERARLDVPFWTAAEDILNTRDTEELKGRVFAFVDNAPRVSLAQVQAVVRTLEEQYSGQRKYTDEADINHAYQVALLTAHAIGWRNLSLGTFITALAHDYHEDTPHHPSDAPHSLSEVADGVVALSHKDDGEPLYPNPKDKTLYFNEIIRVHKDNPDLGIVTVKIMDKIAVANSPLDKDALAQPEFEEPWMELSKRKLGDMRLFLSLLHANNDNGQLDNEIQLLGEVIEFTESRIASQEINPEDETVLFEQPSRNRV